MTDVVLEWKLPLRRKTGMHYIFISDNMIISSLATFCQEIITCGECSRPLIIRKRFNQLLSSLYGWNTSEEVSDYSEYHLHVFKNYEVRGLFLTDYQALKIRNSLISPTFVAFWSDKYSNRKFRPFQRFWICSVFAGIRISLYNFAFSRTDTAVLTQIRSAHIHQIGRERRIYQLQKDQSMSD